MIDWSGSVAMGAQRIHIRSHLGESVFWVWEVELWLGWWVNGLKSGSPCPSLEGKTTVPIGRGWIMPKCWYASTEAPSNNRSSERDIAAGDHYTQQSSISHQDENLPTAAAPKQQSSAEILVQSKSLGSTQGMIPSIIMLSVAFIGNPSE